MHPARFAIIASLALGVQFVASSFSHDPSPTAAERHPRTPVQAGERWLIQAPGERAPFSAYAGSLRATRPDEQSVCVDIAQHRSALRHRPGSAFRDDAYPLIY